MFIKDNVHEDTCNQRRGFLFFYLQMLYTYKEILFVYNYEYVLQGLLTNPQAYTHTHIYICGQMFLKLIIWDIFE